MSEKKIEVIKKEIDLECYVCLGSGQIEDYSHHAPFNVSCPICKGTGIFKDYIYYHIVNGICFSGDTLK